MAEWFYRDGMDVLRVLGVGVPAYVALIALLRISGKRTLSKMNAFDLVITVAFGSALASALLSTSTTLAMAVMAFAFLVTAQLVVTWLSVRSPRFQRLVKADPSLLYFRGTYLEAALRQCRVTREEVEAVSRQQGYATMEQVAAVVLETDGSLSVLSEAGGKSEASLVRGLQNAPGRSG